MFIIIEIYTLYNYLWSVYFLSFSWLFFSSLFPLFLFFPFLFTKHSDSSFIFQSVSLRNLTHFKHHCLSQSHNSFQKRMLTEWLWFFLCIHFLFSHYFIKKHPSLFIQLFFFSISKSWWRFTKTETFKHWLYSHK